MNCPTVSRYSISNSELFTAMSMRKRDTTWAISVGNGNMHVLANIFYFTDETIHPILRLCNHKLTKEINVQGHT